MNLYWVFWLVALGLGRWVHGEFELEEWNVTKVAYETDGIVSRPLSVGLTLIPWAVSRGAGMILFNLCFFILCAFLKILDGVMIAKPLLCETVV